MYATIENQDYKIQVHKFWNLDYMQKVTICTQHYFYHASIREKEGVS